MPRAELLDRRTLPATITVVSGVDDPTIDSLRAAITSLNDGTDANADVAANRTGAYGSDDTILFDIPGSGVRTIALTSELPAIAAPMTIDGYSQPGSSANTRANGDNAKLLIELDGEDAGLSDGLTVNAPGTVIRGLVINRFKTSTTDKGYGVVIQADGVLVEGNFIGTSADGATALGNDRAGIRLNPGSSANTLGGTTPAARNLISGNWGAGIDLAGEGTDDNLIQGNFIGTDVTGRVGLQNHSWGVTLSYQLPDRLHGPISTTIGGTASGAGNLISGNGGYGIIVAGAGVNDTLIQGNFIGTDVRGTVAIPNSIAGVAIGSGTGTTVGGTTAAARNVISGNSQDGVDAAGVGTLVIGNYIGTDLTGRLPIPNLNYGVYVVGRDPQTQFIGGVAPGEGNVIAFNGKGVVVGSGPTSAFSYGAILSNTIFANTTIGIDLGNDGPTPNGVNPRFFPNDGQNYPVITVAGGTRVAGSLNSVPSSNLLLQFFTNLTGGLLPNQLLLGSVEVTTDAAGHATFDATLDIPILVSLPVTSTATLKAQDGSFTQTSEFSTLVYSSAVDVSPASLPLMTVANPFQATLTAVGGSGGPYTFAVTDGALPPGLSLEPSTGLIRGTPTTTGDYSFIAKASAIGGDPGYRYYSGTVNAAISVAPGSLAATTVGSPFETTLTAAGGSGGPYTFAVTAGALPTGLSLEPSTGVVSGTPEGQGAYAFTVTAAATGGDTGSHDYAGLVNAAIALDPATLPTLTADSPFGLTVSAGGGSGGPYTIAVTDGSLPAGLSLDPTTGLIHGTPGTPGAYAFTLTATAQGGDVGRQGYAGVVNAAVPPTVVGLRRYGYHLQRTEFVVGFSSALDATRAEVVGNYALVSLTRHGRPGRRLRLVNATYNPLARTVTLRPRRLVPLRGRYELIVNGTIPTGLTSASGVALDGNGDGRPGSNATLIFGRDVLAGPNLESRRVRLSHPLTGNAGHRKPG